MKHEIVHKYTCEGCGAVRTAYAEIEEFGEHTRKGSRFQRVGASAESEAECIMLTNGSFGWEMKMMTWPECVVMVVLVVVIGAIVIIPKWLMWRNFWH